MQQESPIRDLKGVGAALELKLQRLGITTIQGLVLHLPIRYQDRTRVRALAEVGPGDECVIQGDIQSTDIVQGRRRALVCRLRDETGGITLRFFHFAAAQIKILSPGKRLRCFGEVRPGPSGLEMIHPEYRLITQDEREVTEDTLTPVYPLTEGLPQGRLRTLIHQALEQLKIRGLNDLLPLEVKQHWRLPDLLEALLYLHQPPPSANLALLETGRHPAQRRLALEELLAHHLSLLKVRQQVQQQRAQPLPSMGELEARFLQNLPFALTSAQTRVSDEVSVDLSRSTPMLRLVQGDVGSGKTMIAALAALKAIGQGYQAAVMAPTEILAEQHFSNFKVWFEPLGITVAWLAGKVKGKQRLEQLQRIASGDAALVVGTHALFQEGVTFANLVLIVIDEQHRFGVHQRLSLREKGRDGRIAPHQLIMTATPIPRTLTMTAYADLDCSIIDELPPGRTPVNTLVISDTRRDEVVERVRAACSQGRQAYWVCTLIEESDVLESQAAEMAAQYLTESLPELRIGLIHGRMKATEKAKIMSAFKAAELDLLVATTVIEVGVDVPNASLMIIENPERLGLAQLHQLRGRVGRGSVESYCVLMYHAPLSQQGRERLRVMKETTDGFKIAEKDLELRGPGEVLGTRQTGLMQLRIADLQRDADLLPDVKQIAQAVLTHEGLSDAIIQRWMGSSEAYAQV
ncbi:ATP-dependent DNA helicase RecG [Nitrincola nitratireducens]|uniref:ATP-dependent DNA helicase RecG n=1 Tax=Nitrincola nitratireducens TaxID=1229521 RepID=W9UTP4_9GAMM|nr:ATP-dependent DNA helicase RecG [Nitrincola nitratireducens]EXJ10449.1 ATP-dependent DNA helicase recG [Nitrincola nitratireducens]